MAPQAGWLEAVANPIRLRIVRYLSERDSASLDELAEAVSAQRNTVRSHLRALMSAGVIARLPGEPEGRLGRPPARYCLERREMRRGSAPTPGAARSLRSPVTVVVRDFPPNAPGWTLREPRWAAAVYLLESGWLAPLGTIDYVDYARRRIDWSGLEAATRGRPMRERLLVEVARGLHAREPRGAVSAVASELDPEQRARVLASIALAAGDATVVGVAEGASDSARAS